MRIKRLLLFVAIAGAWLAYCAGAIYVANKAYKERSVCEATCRAVGFVQGDFNGNSDRACNCITIVPKAKP